ncbi:transposase [Streptomyces mirabilis]|uniref:transposase n=1 Tax=Streptomyces mirabilis TaxID=68239 RepID=UPI0036A4BA65
MRRHSRLGGPRGSTTTSDPRPATRDPRSAIRIRFATETCAPCPSRGQCTNSTRYGRQLTVRPQDQDAVLEHVRAEQSTEEWKAVYAIRSGIEGTIHQAVTATGARRTRYAGLGKTALAHILTATAVNLLRLDAWWTGQPLAPTRTSRLAALDLAA